MIISFTGLNEIQQRLADRTLGLQATRVLLGMITSCDYGNIVKASQKDLARHLGMAQQHISKAINDLVASGFVERTSERGHYRISPRVCWKGDEESLRRALAERGMLDANGELTAA